MSSEEKTGPAVPVTEDSEADTKPAKKEDKDAEVDDDRGDDQLVIDEPEEKSDGESEEKEFEPTLDMMMNDFDDEQTMEEEEANEDQENEEDELAALEQEQDMPIEELLKMYGAVPAAASNQDSNSEPAETSTSEKEEKPEEKPEAKPAKDLEEPTPMTSSGENNPESEISDNGKRRGSGSPTPPVKKSKSELARFYEAAVEGRALRSQGGGQAEEGEEEEEEEGVEDSDHENRDYSWKKTIMIGPSYQAAVPYDLATYSGDALPYENEDKLLWNPGHLSSNEVEDYLSKSQEAVQTGGVGSLPLGAHVRDDEQALHLLLQCGYNSEEALRRRRMNAVPTAETMTLWSEEECRAFELGLRLYGKDFHMIQSQKVRTRSVGELVQFYYLWKKTERHDVFANNTRLEKKKYTLHPGTTDYMDRFIDEQDPSRDRSSSPTFYSLMFGGSDGRKGLSLYPGSVKNLHHFDSNGAPPLPPPSEAENTQNSSVTSNSNSSSLLSSTGDQSSSTAPAASSTNGRFNEQAPPPSSADQPASSQ